MKQKYQKYFTRPNSMTEINISELIADFTDFEEFTTNCASCIFLPMAHLITPDQFSNWIDEAEFDPVLKIGTSYTETNFFNSSLVSPTRIFMDTFPVAFFVFCVVRLTIHVQHYFNCTFNIGHSPFKNFSYFPMIPVIIMDLFMGEFFNLHVPWIVARLFDITFGQNLLCFFLPTAIYYYMTANLLGLLILSFSYGFYKTILDMGDEVKSEKSENITITSNIWGGRLRNKSIEYM